MLAQQIKPSVTNPTIADIYQNIESGKLILKPDFQRKFVWTHDHQEEFIDTILKGYPFPEIYVCQGEIDTQKLRTIECVIDGQQRLTTIKKYIDGEHQKPLKKIPKYQDLTEEQKRKFLAYQMVVRDIGEVDEQDIREVFRRINLTKFKLEDVEIHNAIYNGEFIQTAKDILHNIDLSEFSVFYESEFTRMADLHFILLVMSTLEEGGYFSQDKEIETYIVPDIVLFVNGIPLVVIECKSPKLNNPLEQAITDLLKYSNQRHSNTPEGAEKLFYYNLLMVAASQHQAVVGAIGGSYSDYIPWKDPYPTPENEIINQLQVTGLNNRQTLIAGMLKPSHLLDILQNFTLFTREQTKINKIIPYYQQYRAVHKAIDRLENNPTRSQHGDTDQRGGII